MAQACKEYPGRLGSFACLPTLSDTAGVLAKLAHALDGLHAVGISMVSFYGEDKKAVKSIYFGTHAELSPVGP